MGSSFTKVEQGGFKKMIPRCLIILAFANALSALVATLLYRPMYSDGIIFFSWAIDTHSYGYDGRYLRHIYYLMQLPSVFIDKFLTFLPNNTVWSALAFCFSYGLHPVISMMGCYFILRKYRKVQYLVFPLLSYALITVPLMTYPSLTIQETISVFWPLFFLLSFSPLKSRLEIYGGLALSLLLAAGYETSVLFFIVNASILIIRGQTGLLFISQILGGCWILFRLLGPNAGPNEAFLESFSVPLTEGFHFYTFCGVMAVAALLLKPKKWLILPLIFLCLMTLYWGMKDVIFFPDTYLWQAFTDRTRATPLTSILALLAYWANAKKKELRPLFYFCMFALVISCAYDILATYYYARGVSYAEKMANENEGCNIIPLADFEEQFAVQHAIKMWPFPLISVQPHKTLKPKSVFFVEDPVTGDSCRVVDGMIGKNENVKIIALPVNGALDLSLIIKEPIYVHSWNPEIKQWTKKRLVR